MTVYQGRHWESRFVILIRFRTALGSENIISVRKKKEVVTHRRNDLLLPLCKGRREKRKSKVKKN